MTAKGFPAPRLWLVGLLVLVLSLAGVGRGWTAAADVPDVLPSIPGVTVHICHAPDGGGRPDAPPQHDCCDACALCAPATLPDNPVLAAAARVEHVMSHAIGVPWAPMLARTRTPRLAQGPPSA